MMHLLSARQLRHKFCDGELSASSILDYFLHRIHKFDPKVGAFLSLFEERAWEKAKELDEKRRKGESLGKLAGIPIALKDNIHVKGEISTCGSKFLTNYRSPFSATVTRLLEEEGAIIIGKTNMDEFAMGSSTENSALQKTKNPWKLTCVPGGSSGGSAAAVAARMVPLAFGSDTGGSVRQPASLCGIVGFKPTYGRVSRFGLVAYGSSLDQIGPFSAHVEDIALVMEILGRPCERDSTSLQSPPEDYLENLDLGLAGLKVAVPWHLIEGIEKETKENFIASIARLKDLGATIVECRLDLLKYCIPVYYILATAEASTNLARFDGIRYGVRSSKAKTLDEIYDFSKQEGFGPEVKRRILLGTYVLSSGYKDAYYRKAQKVRTLIIREYNKIFGSCQLIATPTFPYPAFEAGAIHDPLQMYLADIYTIGINLAGIPAINVPSGLTQDGKPLGLQLLGAQRRDVLVCQAARAFEHFHELPPLIRHA